MANLTAKPSFIESPDVIGLKDWFKLNRGIPENLTKEDSLEYADVSFE